MDSVKAVVKKLVQEWLDEYLGHPFKYKTAPTTDDAKPFRISAPLFHEHDEVVPDAVVCWISFPSYNGIRVTQHEYDDEGVMLPTRDHLHIRYFPYEDPEFLTNFQRHMSTLLDARYSFWEYALETGLVDRSGLYIGRERED